MEDLLKRITVDDEICNGKPVIRGLRITVQTIIEYLLTGSSPDDVLKEYPVLEQEDIEACKLFALKLMNRNFSMKEIAA